MKTLISDDDIEYTTEENLEVDIDENIKEDNKEDIKDEISEDIKGAPVYIFEDDEDDDVIVFGLEDDMEDVIEEDIDDIEDISEDIIQELDEEDLETNESEGNENMREYKAPRRKKDEDAFDDSPDVIVPLKIQSMKVVMIPNQMDNPNLMKRLIMTLIIQIVLIITVL